MKKLLPVMLMVLSGCATSPGYIVSGGDRGAGTVRLVCHYDLFTLCDTAVTPQMQKSAKDTCKRWGYVDASPFGGYVDTKTVGQYTGYISIDYQCVGDLEL